MQNQTFAADRKGGRWFSREWEDSYLRPRLVKLVPAFVETYHLTLLTLVWSAGVVGFSWLAQDNLHWLWACSLMIVCQYVTDLLDGSIGRARNTGLIKWGYYMDHFLDYIFFTAIIFGYSFIFPSDLRSIFIFLALTQIGFMISLFLSFSVTQDFRISFLNFGPTETRVMYILFNTYLAFFGLEYPSLLMPYFAIATSVVLVAFVYSTQKRIWNIDMEHKKEEGRL